MRGIEDAKWKIEYDQLALLFSLILQTPSLLQFSRLKQVATIGGKIFNGYPARIEYPNVWIPRKTRTLNLNLFDTPEFIFRRSNIISSRD